MNDPDFSQVPACLAAATRARWQEVAAACPVADPLWERVRATAPVVFAASDFVAQTCAVHPALLTDLVQSGDLFASYAPGVFAGRLQAPNDLPLKTRLRQLRRREMVRIAWRDLAHWAELDETLRDLSALADACLEAALDAAYRAAEAKHGVPIAEQSGAPVRLVVLALGKLGGEELNFSSDIDLILAYSEDGETNGERALSNHEFFGRVTRELVGLLTEPTEDGIVFRVDLRLRPNGASGPLALSFDAMEHYYQVHGREWERYALIKARPAAGDVAGGQELLASLRPFVFRKYLDYGALSAIRELKESINREVARKGADNIKVGEGGIREIEFIGQAFQLIRGGRMASLQARRIQQVLPLLAQMQHLTPHAVAELLAAYRFLRDTEHRLQMAADRQTHTLPSDPCEQARLAFAMSFADYPAFHDALRRHRQKVHGHFEQVFIAPQGEAAGEDERLRGVWLDLLDAPAQASALRSAGFGEDDVDVVRDLLRGVRAGSAYQAFSAHGRERADRLMPLLLAAAGRTSQPGVTLARLVKIVEAIGRRSAYLALLIENPMALSQLVKLVSASAWITDWLASHPILLDELLNPATLYSLPAPADLQSELRDRLAGVPAEDLEAQMERLREFRHAHVLRAAAAEVGPGLAPAAARVHLCHVAEAVLAESLALARFDLVRRHGQPRCRDGERREVPGFAVIGYGKLGSYELGYGSDLDLIFLHEACAGEGQTEGNRSVPNELFFARLGQRLIHLLTTRTAAGVLYQVDMRLRPSGQAGPLVTNLEAFRNYQRERAWVWEHQALVRARAVAGDQRVRDAFEAIRQEILCLPREPDKLRAEVVAMRARMREAQPAHDPALFDLKQDPGGIVDIEFMVQYWVLRWAAAHPQLAGHTENGALMRELAGAGLIEQTQAETLTAAYHRYLSLEQRLKLMDQRPLVARADLGADPEAVTAVWRAVFDQTTTE